MTKDNKELTTNQIKLLEDMAHANSAGAAIVRPPLITDPDGSTHGEYEKCSYAFYPSCQLCAYEPEIVAKVFDALLFQNPDTAMFMGCCGKPLEMCGLPVDGVGDIAGNTVTVASVGETESAINTEVDILTTSPIDTEVDILMTSPINDIRNKWDSLGQPTMIMACPACMKIFNDYLPEIPTISVYEMFVEYGIGGGCNSVDYAISHHPAAPDEMREAVETLAEDMGVTLHKSAESVSRNNRKSDSNSEHLQNQNSTQAEALNDLPIITYSIAIRNGLKSKGKNSAHILELMFGMGESNAHLTHEHDHGGEDDGDEATQVLNGVDVSDANIVHDADPKNSIYAGRSDDVNVGEVNNVTNELGSQTSKIVNSVPLPGSAKCRENREELREALLALYWNEM